MSDGQKIVTVFTSTRADYGLLKPLIDRLNIVDPGLKVNIFVTGSHLDRNFGYTIEEIEAEHSDLIGYRTPIPLNGESGVNNLDVMAKALEFYALALRQRRPDLCVVLGDRFEALCFGLCAATLNIPLAHIHGGELTYGAIDDKFRHCLTKLSEWHFVASETYRKRVIQLGESPTTVFNVGALGVENALRLKLKSKEELEQELGTPLNGEVYLLTFHPETNSPDYGVDLCQRFLEKLKRRVLNVNGKVVVTGVNADAGAKAIRDVIEQFVADLGERAHFVESLGSLRYLSMVAQATAVVGNSSSGILEAYSLGTPTINVGTRQDGRERESSVRDFKTAASLDDLDFDRIVELKESLRTARTPSLFGQGEASERIAAQIAAVVRTPVQSGIVKTFFDL